MATLKQIVNGNSSGLTWLEFEDSDGKRWKYNKGKAAPSGAVVHVAQGPDGKLVILPADDGQPRLRQASPGLPGKMIVQLRPVPFGGPGPGLPVLAGFGGGDYEYVQ